MCGALSKARDTKKIPKEGTNWGVDVTAKDIAGKVIHGTDGKPLKTKIRMANGCFADGSPQEFYFPRGHPQDGMFKGMSIILEEQGYTNTVNLRAECPKFKCPPDAMQCCCRRLLYNEPDFVNIPSLLEIQAQNHGYKLIFLPKFHCELNFIEQCWGDAKRTYCLSLVSSKEEDLRRNMLSSLDSISIEGMRRFIQSLT